MRYLLGLVVLGSLFGVVTSASAAIETVEIGARARYDEGNLLASFQTSQDAWNRGEIDGPWDVSFDAWNWSDADSSLVFSYKPDEWFSFEATQKSGEAISIAWDLITGDFKDWLNGAPLSNRHYPYVGIIEDPPPGGVIPEPGSLVLWTMLGGASLLFCFVRQRRCRPTADQP